MNHVFSVTLSNRFEYSSYRRTYEAVASTAKKAIDKALGRARKDGPKVAGWEVEGLEHRGRAI